MGFCIPKSMVHFEAFRWNISSSINLLFLKSAGEMENSSSGENVFEKSALFKNKRFMLDEID